MWLDLLRRWKLRLWHWIARRVRGDPRQHSWEEAEFGVRPRLARGLADYLDASAKCERLGFEMLKRIPKLGPDQDVLRVHATLVARVLRDLRACELCLLAGYPMQGWTLAASCFEAAHTMGFIRDNPDRAKKWLEHQDREKAPINAYDAVTNTLIYLDIESDPAKRTELANNEYDLYQQLCMAKHVNPIPERNRYWVRRSSGQVFLQLTPIATDRVVREARLGLTLAVRAAATALWIFRRTQLPNSTEIDDDLVKLGNATILLIKNWKIVAPREDGGPEIPEPAV